MAVHDARAPSVIQAVFGPLLNHQERTNGEANALEPAVELREEEAHKPRGSGLFEPRMASCPLFRIVGRRLWWLPGFPPQPIQTDDLSIFQECHSVMPPAGVPAS